MKTIAVIQHVEAEYLGFLATVHTLRQQTSRARGRAENYALADFVAPKDSGIPDYLGGFVVTAGVGEAERVAAYEAEHDDFVHLPVEGRWVMALRYMPEGASPERRQHLAGHVQGRRAAHDERHEGRAALATEVGEDLFDAVHDGLIRRGTPATAPGTVPGPSREGGRIFTSFPWDHRRRCTFRARRP